MLAGTPYCLDGAFGPAVNPLYFFIALGLIAGFVGRDVLERAERRFAQGQGGRGAAIVQMAKPAATLARIAAAPVHVAALGVIAANWAVFPAYRGHLSQSGIGFFAHDPALTLLFAGLIDAAPCVMALSAFACAFAHPRRPKHATPTEGVSEAGGLASCALPIAGFLIGFCTRLAFVALYEGGYEGGILTVAVPESIAANLAPAAYALAFFACAMAASARMQGQRPDDAFRSCALPFGLGMVAWTLMTRAVPVYDAVSSQAAAWSCALVLAAAIGACIFAAHRTRRIADSACTQTGADARSDLADRYALSPRESQAVALALEGLASGEAAERMGIKASTVRSLLRRAYGKMGISGRDELLLMGRTHADATPAKTPDSNRADEPARSSDQASCGPSPNIVACAAAAACVVMLPHHVPYHAWGLGREVVYGLALACFVAAAARLAAPSPAVASMRRAVEKSGKAVAFASCASGAVLLAASTAIARAEFAQGIESLVLFWSSALFTLSLCACISCARAVPASGKSRAGLAMPVACSLATACSFFCFEAWIVSGIAVLALLGANVAHAAFRHGGEGGRTCICAPGHDASALLIPIAFACGIVFEESWRSQGTFSLFMALSPFLVATPVCIACVLAKTEKQPIAGTLLWYVAPSFAVCAIARNGIAAIAPTAFFLCLLCAAAARRGITGARGAAFALASCGAGCLFGDVFVNYAADRLADQAVPLLEMFRTRESFEIVMAYLMGLLSLGAAGSCALLCLHLYRASTLDLSLSKASTTQEERMRAYLKGRGLSEAYAVILADIACGKSSRQIAHERCYAHGSIKAARYAGYRLLDINSQAELVALLKQETSRYMQTP